MRTASTGKGGYKAAPVGSAPASTGKGGYKAAPVGSAPASTGKGGYKAAPVGSAPASTGKGGYKAAPVSTVKSCFDPPLPDNRNIWYRISGIPGKDFRDLIKNYIDKNRREGCCAMKGLYIEMRTKNGNRKQEVWVNSDFDFTIFNSIKENVSLRSSWDEGGKIVGDDRIINYVWIDQSQHSIQKAQSEPKKTLLKQPIFLNGSNNCYLGSIDEYYQYLNKVILLNDGDKDFINSIVKLAQQYGGKVYFNGSADALVQANWINKSFDARDREQANDFDVTVEIADYNNRLLFVNELREKLGLTQKDIKETEILKKKHSKVEVKVCEYNKEPNLLPFQNRTNVFFDGQDIICVSSWNTPSRVVFDRKCMELSPFNKDENGSNAAMRAILDIVSKNYYACEDKHNFLKYLDQFFSKKNHANYFRDGVFSEVEFGSKLEASIKKLGDQQDKIHDALQRALTLMRDTQELIRNNNRLNSDLENGIKNIEEVLNAKLISKQTKPGISTVDPMQVLRNLMADV